MGVCGHKNVCHICCLRLRLLLEDDYCPYCKTELEEVVISSDKSLEWSFFKKKLLKKCKEDPEDDTIYYHTPAAEKECLKLRNLTCMIGNCKHH